MESIGTAVKMADLDLEELTISISACEAGWNTYERRSAEEAQQHCRAELGAAPDEKFLAQCRAIEAELRKGWSGSAAELQQEKHWLQSLLQAIHTGCSEQEQVCSSPPSEPSSRTLLQST